MCAVRTRSEDRGPRSSFRADVGAVALLLEFMSGVFGFPDNAPLSSYRCGKTEIVAR